MPDLARKLAREIEMFLDSWPAFKGALKIEADLQKELSSLFSDVADEVINQLGKQLTGGDAQKGGATVKGFVDKLKEVILEYAKRAAESGQKKATAGLDIQDTKEISQSVLDNLESRIFEGAQSTMDRVSGSVMDALSMAYDEGMGIDETARLLRDDVFKDLETWEAERIARTEIHTAQGEASHGVIDDNADYRQWITAEDDRVRDSHADMHGQIVRSGDPYSNGLMYPGDMSGDIEEYINCRCVEVAFEMPEGMTAPDEPYFSEEDLVEIPVDEAA
jgi:SPP1 gp7 family putative phage head morphogenesis protein